ncbi:MAG: Gx transporter family protein [Firmicutes bacterium]|nr:Gx transporter family protein [Bacillota bacterium]
MLTTLATVLHVLEGMLPPLPVPGAKLGLANIITVATIALLGARFGLAVAVSRVILGSLLIGFSVVGFAMSMSGALLSWLVMVLLYGRFRERLSLVGISLAGAVAHNVAQLTVASWVLEQVATFTLLPYLLFFAVPTGIMVGLTAGLLIKAMAKAKIQGGLQR